MTYETFVRKYERFQDNNQELMDDYELHMGDQLENYIPCLYDAYNKFSKLKPQTDTNNFLEQVIRGCVTNDICVFDSVDATLQRAAMPDNERGTLQQYFSEISKAYEKNNNNYNIEYSEENREKLIEMNLKTVISVAKGYQGMGLSLEDLIGAGNLGLVEAFKKYDPQRATLKTDMLKAIEPLPDDVGVTTMIEVISPLMKYGKIKKKFINVFNLKGESDDKYLESIYNNQLTDIPWRTFTKQELHSWVKQNIKNATFNSVAYMWIKAYILIELDTNSRLVKKTKTDIQEDREKFGSYQKEVILDIDAPMGDDSDTKFADMLCSDDDVSDWEAAESREMFDRYLNKLLDGVKPRDRAVFLKKYGIGKPRELSPKEIAKQENLSIARVSQILQKVMEQIQANQAKFGIEPDVMFEMVSKMKEQ